MESSPTLLTLMQISDSTYPTGGFSHSVGLEAALKAGWVHNKDSLKRFILCTLDNMGTFALPFMREAYQNCDDPKHLSDLDDMLEACTPNHVAKRASQRQGVSMLDTSNRVFGNDRMIKLASTLSFKHQPVVYGLICGNLHIDLEAAMSTFLYSAVRTVIASAVRLDRVGPLEAQAIQHQIQKSIPVIVERNRTRSVDDACMAFPSLDIVQNTHDTMFSKLFYS